MLLKTARCFTHFFVVIVLIMQTLCFQALALEQKTVKVGYVYLPNSTKDSNNEQMKSGFAYDYLQEIANLSGWKYEYIYGKDDELYEMLKNGTIDVLAGVPYSSEISGNISFPDLPMTSESHNIYVHEDNNVSDFDLKDLESKNVGVKANSISLSFLRKWNDNGNYKLNIIEYQNNEEGRRAFDAYEIDAFAAPDMQVLSSYGMTPVARIGTTDIYVAVTKKRKDLLTDLNQAQAIIESSDPYFSSRLHEKYFSNLAVRKTLSSREKGWLEEHDVINVGYIENYPPLSSVDQNGEPLGIVIDIIKKIFDRYDLSTAVTFTPYADFNKMLADIRMHKLDLIAPICDSYWYSEKEGILQSAEFVSVPMTLIYKNADTIDEETIFAKPYGSYFDSFPIDTKYPDNPKIHCQNDTDCISKVENGDADVTLLNTYQSVLLLKDHPQLQAKDAGFVSRFCVGASGEGQPLLTIINRGLTSSRMEEVPDWLVNHPEDTLDTSWESLIKNHFLTLVILLIVLITALAVILIAAIHQFRYRKNQLKLTPHLNKDFDFSANHLNEFIKEGMQKNLKTGEAKEQVLKNLLSNREYFDLLKDFLNSYEVQHDALTGLPSVSHFMELSKQTRINDSDLRVIIAFNLNGFKDFNAVYGLNAGDNLLKEFARILADTFGHDCCARFGEDLFYACSIRAQAEERINNVFVQMSKANKGKTLSVRVGIYVEDTPSVNIVTSCDLAREALKNNKNTATSSFIYFEKDMYEEVINREYILRNYESAIRNGFIKVLYQPKVKASDGSLMGFEAKVQWLDPQKGLILPSEFIPVLDKHNVTSKIDLFVTEQIVRDIARTKDAGRKMLPVSLNVSLADFKECTLCSRIQEICQKYNVPQKLLQIEISEFLLVNSPLHIKLEIQSFRNAGFDVLMDNFGNGYSTLSLLRDYEFDEIKLDSGFMKNYGKKSKAILKPIVSMAKELNIRTLADGVENTEQLDFLKNIGCEMIQGPLSGEAVSYDDLIRQFFFEEEKHAPLRTDS